jgi:hypothetical protein
MKIKVIIGICTHKKRTFNRHAVSVLYMQSPDMHCLVLAVLLVVCVFTGAATLNCIARIPLTLLALSIA